MSQAAKQLFDRLDQNESGFIEEDELDQVTRATRNALHASLCLCAPRRSDSPPFFLSLGFLCRGAVFEDHWSC